MKNHSEFALTRTEGKAKAGSFLVVSTALSGENISSEKAPSQKFGIIATKKIGNAVVRNKQRRRIHAIYAKHAGNIKNLDGNRYIVTILRWRAPDATYAELEKDWLKQANRLGILASQ